TVSQLGYMVYAIGVGGLMAAQFHLLSHSIFKALLFLSAGAVIHSIGTRDMLRMGGLGVRMPFVRNVFIVGALALAGLPILNGFWSKELILEAGFTGSPLWVYALMLFGAGLTAYYTLRMTWLVFFGEQRVEHKLHPTGLMMKLSLGLLALGAFTSWLLFGGLNTLLTHTLPFHALKEETTWEVVTALLSTPLTWLVLLIIFFGCGIFWISRERALFLPKGNILINSSFGLETLNGIVLRSVQGISKKMQITQTGQLNWNVFGILLALLIVLAALMWGIS
ncbi:MAG: proton-conducting transporter membrane subunit, partial [Anaerolineales bacterium]